MLDEAGERAGGAMGAEYAHLDVTSAAAWGAVVGDVVARHGRIDGLVNNAGTGQEFTVDGGVHS